MYAFSERRQRGVYKIDLAGNVGCQRVIPLFRWDLVDAAGRPGNAGIVDKAIKSAERVRRRIDKSRDGVAVGDIAQRCLQLRIAGCQCRERVAVDIANLDLRAFAQESAPDLAADAAGARANADPQTFDALVTYPP